MPTKNGRSKENDTKNTLVIEKNKQCGGRRSKSFKQRSSAHQEERGQMNPKAAFSKFIAIDRTTEEQQEQETRPSLLNFRSGKKNNDNNNNYYYNNYCNNSNNNNNNNNNNASSSPYPGRRSFTTGPLTVSYNIDPVTGLPSEKTERKRNSNRQYTMGPVFERKKGGGGGVSFPLMSGSDDRSCAYNCSNGRRSKSMTR
jgi:hypothetical protein